MKNNKETQLQIQISNYIKLQYPTKLFKADLSGMNIPKRLAAENKKMRNGRGYADLEILEPNSEYHGLFIELKTSSPFKKNGHLKKDDHLKEQSEMLTILNQKGYKAVFCWSFEMAKAEIDKYMSIPVSKQKIFSTNRVSSYYPK